MKLQQLIFFLFFPALLQAQIITTVAGNGILGYSGDNDSANLAKLHIPGNVIIDNSHNFLYIADSWGHRIRKVNLNTNIITTVAGNGIAGYNGDGILATSAQLNNPIGLALDSSGNLYICDALNYRIRKIVFTTGIISTIAGNGISGFSGDNGPPTMAQIKPGYIVFDAQGNLYISGGNHRIRKINTVTNIITTICGNGIAGYNGDNIAADTATLNWPQGIAFDAQGNLFIADLNNNRIRKVNINTGIITTICGNGIAGYNGNGIPANTSNVNGPFSIVFDKMGNLYFGEFPGNRIRKITITDTIYNVSGTGIGGYNGDEILADTAQLNEPTGIAFDSCQNLFIADASNERIRKITFNTHCENGDTTTAVNDISTNPSIRIFPNPVQNLLQIDNVKSQISYSLENMIGIVVKKGILKNGNNNVNVSAISQGVYYLKLIADKNEIQIEKIIKQ